MVDQTTLPSLMHSFEICGVNKEGLESMVCRPGVFLDVLFLDFGAPVVGLPS